MRTRQRVSLALAAASAMVLVACTQTAGNGAEQAGATIEQPKTAFQPAPSTPPTPPPLPTGGSGSFTVAPAGASAVAGTGSRRVRYRVELENGIVWGENVVWTAADFADRVDRIIAAPLGWTMSARYPVSNADVDLAGASWSFQRVAGAAYEVQVRLATPATVQRLCAANGVQTDGVYSCRFGKTLMINLGRWLNGADGYPVTLDEYRSAVINHELGHFLGFDHMRCPGPGQPGPIMMTQTIDLQGCRPYVYPFLPDGTFPSGPWLPS